MKRKRLVLKIAIALLSFSYCVYGPMRSAHADAVVFTGRPSRDIELTIRFQEEVGPSRWSRHTALYSLHITRRNAPDTLVWTRRFPAWGFRGGPDKSHLRGFDAATHSDWAFVLYSVGTQLMVDSFLVTAKEPVNVHTCSLARLATFTQIHRATFISESNKLTIIFERRTFEGPDRYDKWEVSLGHGEPVWTSTEQRSTPRAKMGELSEIVEAMRAGKIDKIVALIQGGADPNTRDDQEMTPAMYLAKGGTVEALKAIVPQGADLNLVDDSGRDALAWAIKTSQLDCVRYLTTEGKIPIDRLTNSGLGPLHRCALLGRQSIAEYLLDRGADINLRAHKGRTALMYAVEQNRVDLAAFLLDRGANPQMKDLSDESALSMARQDGSREMLQMLKEKVKQ